MSRQARRLRLDGAERSQSPKVAHARFDAPLPRVRDWLGSGERPLLQATMTHHTEWRSWAENLGRTIVRARLFAGLTQHALAERALVSQASVSRLEGGHGIDTPLRSIMSVLSALADELRTLPPTEVPADVLWLLGVPQLTPWAHPEAPPPSASERSLQRVIARYRAMPPTTRVQFVVTALAIADALEQ